MVCCTQFGLLFVLIVFCSVMHVFPIGLAVITFLDERKMMMKQLPELQTLLIPDNDRTLTAAYLMVLGSIGMLLNNLAVVGLWLKRRVFLMPVSFYFCIWLSLDFFTIFCHFVYDDRDVDPSSLSSPFIAFSWWALLVNVCFSNLSRHRTEAELLGPSFILGFNLYLTLFRIILTLLVLRLIVNVYTWDVRMRASRSPCRTGRSADKNKQKKKQNYNFSAKQPIASTKYRKFINSP